MLKAEISMGKSAVTDVVVTSDLYSIEVGSGKLALFVGEAIIEPEMSSGELLKRAKEAGGIAESAHRSNQEPLRVEFTDPHNSASAVITVGELALSSNATIGAVINSVGVDELESRTGLISAGLTACLIALKERIYQGQTSIPA